jgi:hypothetical protein
MALAFWDAAIGREQALAFLGGGVDLEGPDAPPHYRLGDGPEDWRWTRRDLFLWRLKWRVPPIPTDPEPPEPTAASIVPLPTKRPTRRGRPTQKAA